jgi:uncharacterized protein YdeI (YjbR/CyaY-like superfamily)
LTSSPSSPQFFESADQLHAWFGQHHASASHLWIGFHKKTSASGGLQYAEALDAALCFGWIDGVRKSISATSYMIRFSPRKSKSIWSRINIKRALELSASGQMHPSGLKVFESRREEATERYSYEQGKLQMPPSYLARFQQNQKAWRYFQSTPVGYQRKATWWLISAKQEPTRERRLEQLIEGSAKSQRLPVIEGKTNRE